MEYRTKITTWPRKGTYISFIFLGYISGGFNGKIIYKSTSEGFFGFIPQGRGPAWWLPRKLDDKTPLRVCPEIRLPQWAEQIKKT